MYARPYTGHCVLKCSLLLYFTNERKVKTLVPAFKVKALQPLRNWENKVNSKLSVRHDKRDLRD